MTVSKHSDGGEIARNRDEKMWVAWLLVAGLLILRIPFLGGMRLINGILNDFRVLPTFEVSTYLIVAALIWLERDRLSDYHIDKLALAIIIIGKPLELLLARYLPGYGRGLINTGYLLYIPTALALLAGLLIVRPNLPQRGGWRYGLWLIGGIIAGSLVGAYAGWLILRGPKVRILTASTLLLLPLQQMLYAGIAEEPVFRGFLWGLLKKAGWHDGWVWVVQGLLFWSAHIYWLENSPLTFWVIVPLGAFLFGALAWGSRSIAVTMISHGFCNALLNIVVYYHLP